MDQSTLLLVAFVVAVLAVAAALRAIRIRETAAAGPVDSPLAISTEGMKVCPKCGMGNLWTDRTCMGCRGPLRG